MSSTVRTPARMDSVTWLLLYLTVLYAIPSRLVVPALGSAGSPSMLVGLVSLGGWALYQVGRTTSQSHPREVLPVRRALFGFVACVAITYVVAMSRPIDFDEISPVNVAMAVTLSWSGTLLVAHDGISTMERARTLATALAWAGGLMAFLGLMQVVTSDPIINRISIPGLSAAEFQIFTRGETIRPSGTATHPIEYGVIMAMLLPFTLHAAFHTTHDRRLLQWIPTLMVGVTIALTFSRSAYVSAAVAAAVLVVGWPRQRRRLFLAGALAMAVVLFAAVPRLFGTIQSLFRNVGTDPSITSRTDSYEIAWAFITQSPAFGRGLGSFLPKYRIFDNQYLLLMVSIGLVGTAAFLLLALAGLWVSLRVRLLAQDEDTRDLGLSLLAAIAAGATGMALFDSFAFPMTMGTYFLLLGMAGAVHRIVVLEPRRPDPALVPTGSTVPHPLRVLRRAVTRRLRRRWARQVRASSPEPPPGP